MASFIVKNMQYVTGTGRSRIPRNPPANASAPAGLAPIDSHLVVSNAGPGTFCMQQPPDASKTVGNSTLYYAFTSLSGGVEGGMVTNDISNPNLHETMANSGADIIQLNVYLPHGNLGPGGTPGALIDAFNESTGTFVDDIFVKVTPDDASGSLTHDANYLGAFTTAKAAETVNADQHISPSNVVFDQWMIMPGFTGPNDHVTGSQLSVGKNSNLVAFAFYRPATKNDLFDHKPDGWWEHGGKTVFDTLHINPGDIVSNPGLIKQLQEISLRLGTVEAKLNEKGSAFIKTTSRPAVGKTVTSKANKRVK